MTDIKTAYGSEAQAITCTLASLASSATAGRESAAVDNTSNLWLDTLVYVAVKLTSGTPGNDKAVYVYVAGTVDKTTPKWPDEITGLDAAITFDNPTNLRLLGVINAPTASATFRGGPWSVASVFGGVLPEKWSIAIRNYTNIALDATEGNHTKIYQGIYSTAI